MIDFSKLEIQSATLKIANVQLPANGNWGWVEFEGMQQRVKLAPDAPQKVSEKLEVGQEHEARISVKVREYQGEKLHEGYLVSWGAKKGGGGFGGGKWQPKTMDEIIASYPCVSAREANAYAMAENLRKGMDAKDHISWEQICKMTKEMAAAMAESHAIIKGKLA